MKNNLTKKHLMIYALLLGMLCAGLFLNSSMNQKANLESNEKTEIQNKSTLPKTSVTRSESLWFNDSWDYRVSVNVSANGAQQIDVPVELSINFTEYFKDPELGLGPVEINTSTIRVIEYTSTSSYYEVPSQFEPYTYDNIYDNETNAVGDLIWIMNGTTGASSEREYFVYFNSNESSLNVPESNYDPIRLWHEGFEDSSINLQSAYRQDGQPSEFEISSEISARGNKSLNIWGDCWKFQDIGKSINVDSDTAVTAKMRYDNDGPPSVREIVGICFTDVNPTGVSNEDDKSYNTRGTQTYGNEKYRNDPDVVQSFLWYSFYPDSELTAQLTDFQYVVYIGDDERDPSPEVDLYWDDISVWSQQVQTQPENPVIVTKGEIEQKSGDLKITCIDTDGFKVPNAHVFIKNDTLQYLNQDSFTDYKGESFFTNISSDDTYNITVEYTTQEGLTSPLSVNFTIENYIPENVLLNEIVFKLDLWTMFFNITDADGDPLENAYVKIDNGTHDLGKKYLDSKGFCNITWVNDDKYNYSIYYDYSRLNDESTYYNTEQFVYNGTISRTFVDKPKNESYEESISSANWDEWNIIAGTPDDIVATKVFRPENGTVFSEFNITVKEMQEYLESFTVDLESNGKWIENVYIYENTDPVRTYVDNHSFYFNYTNTPNQLHPSAVRLTIRKNDASQTPHGTFNITYIENIYENIQTNISTVYFNVTDSSGGDNYLENAIVRIFNKTDNPIYPNVANLTVQEDGSAKFIGLNNQTEDWGNYSIKIGFPEDDRYIKKAGESLIYKEILNITFDNTLNLSVLVNLNVEYYNMSFSSLNTNPNNLQNNFYWGGDIDLDFTVYINQPGTFEDAETPDQLKLEIVNTDLVPIGSAINLLPYETASEGNFEYTLDTSTFNLIGGESYNLKITAKKAGYQSSEPLIKGFLVRSVPTSMSIHNTTSPTLAPLTDNVTAYYNELVYLTVNYKSAGGPLTDATVTYDWQFESDPVPIQADGSYYSFVINTSRATNVGKYELEISASKENYSSVVNFGFDLIILRRPTSVNGLTKLQHISQRIWVREAVNYTFEYNDTLIDKRLGNVDEAFYHWYELDEQGDQIGNVSDDIELYQTNDSLYVLDFDTETRDVGYYALFITLHKNNYETRSVVIDLTIRKRVFNTSLTGTNLQGSQVDIVQGNDVELQLTLEDPTNDGDPLTDANVTLSIGGNEYVFNETEDGVYTYTFTTEQIEAFFAGKTLTGNVTIEKEDYETKTVPITIAVKMTEIFPGMPSFYFIMIVGSAIAVGGSLAGYRYYQLAKIPEFVKRARAMSKNIKSGKPIDETLLYPSKKEFMVEELSDRWESIGLSLASILGIKTEETKVIKKKTPPKKKIKTKTPEPEVEAEVKSEPETKSETEPESELEPEEGGAE